MRGLSRLAAAPVALLAPGVAPGVAIGLAIGVAIGLVCGCAPKSAGPANWAAFGDDTVKAPETDVQLADLPSASGRVRVSATVADVCKVKGCWMTVVDDSLPSGTETLVRFRDYSFFVPRNAIGRHVILVGEAMTNELSVEALRHLAHDAGKTDGEIALITEPRVETTIIADAVWIQGAGLQEPYRAIGQERCEPLEPVSAR